MNQFKSKLFRTYKELDSYRIFIQEGQLTEFWETQTLLEMERILTIHDVGIIQILGNYLSYYLSQLRIGPTQAYYVSKNNKTLAYIYDCKIFQSKTYENSQNQFLSSLLIAYRQDTTIDFPIHQFLNTQIFQDTQSILKTKTSCILRVYSILKLLNLQPLNSDIIVIPKIYYYSFLQLWVSSHMNFGVQFNLNYLFKGIMLLFKNQILLEYFNSLTPQERHQRQYDRPLKIIKKPKNKSQFTMPERRFGQVKWQSLKTQIFKLKYKVVEEADEYLCYRPKQQIKDDQILDFNELSIEDKNIFLCFQIVKESKPKCYNQY